MISCFSVHDPDGAEADLSETDAEDEVAEAEARAEAARARLEKLRGSAETEDADDDAACPRCRAAPGKVDPGDDYGFRDAPGGRSGSRRAPVAQPPRAESSSCSALAPCSSPLLSARPVTCCGSTTPRCTSGSSPRSSPQPPGKGSQR